MRRTWPWLAALFFMLLIAIMLLSGGLESDPSRLDGGPAAVFEAGLMDEDEPRAAKRRRVRPEITRSPVAEEAPSALTMNEAGPALDGAVVVGRVVDGADQPLEGIRILMRLSSYYVQTDSPNAASTPREVVSAADGAFRFSGIPPGFYDVLVKDAPESLTQTRHVLVAEGEGVRTHLAPIVVERGRRRVLHFRVHRSGAPHAATITVHRFRSRTAESRVTTDANGHAIVDGIVSGETVHFRVEASKRFAIDDWSRPTTDYYQSFNYRAFPDDSFAGALRPVSDASEYEADLVRGWHPRNRTFSSFSDADVVWIDIDLDARPPLDVPVPDPILEWIDPADLGEDG